MPKCPAAKARCIFWGEVAAWRTARPRPWEKVSKATIHPRIARILGSEADLDCGGGGGVAEFAARVGGGIKEVVGKEVVGAVSGIEAVEGLCF